MEILFVHNVKKDFIDLIKLVLLKQIVYKI